MADRKMTVEVQVALTIRADEGIALSEILNTLTYSFNVAHPNANIEGEDMVSYSLHDSNQWLNT